MHIELVCVTCVVPKWHVHALPCISRLLFFCYLLVMWWFFIVPCMPWLAWLKGWLYVEISLTYFICHSCSYEIMQLGLLNLLFIWCIIHDHITHGQILKFKIVQGGKLLWLVMSDSNAWPSMLCYALLHGILSFHSYIFFLFLYFANSERPRALIGELNCTEILLRILQEYDILSKT